MKAFMSQLSSYYRIDLWQIISSYLEKQISDEGHPAETCTICSEPAIENIMECAWCEYKRHSTCLGISVKHFFRCCTLLFMLLTPPMQSYENQTRDNEKLQMVKQNFNQTLDALEHKITEVIKSIESQLGKHHKSLSITTYQHIHNI